MGISFFSEILSFVLSVIARLGFKDRVWFGLSHFLVTAHVIFVQSSTSTWGQYFSPIWIYRKLWITVTGWMATWSFLTAKYFQPWLQYASWHYVMLKAKQAWCLLASWLVAIVLCLGDQSICFTEFDDRHPSMGVNLRGPQTLNSRMFQLVTNLTYF